MSFGLFVISAFAGLISLFNIVLGLVVLVRDARNPRHQLFFLLSVLIGLWIPANFAGGVVKDPDLAIALVKTDFALGIMLIAAVLLFANAVGSYLFGAKRLFVIVTVITVPLALSVVSGAAFDLSAVADGVHVSETLVGFVYDLSAAVLLIASIGVLIRKHFRTNGLAKEQNDFILLGLSLLIIVVGIANLGIPLLTNDVLVHNFVQRFAYLGFVGFNVLATYVIIKRHLFDIRIILARSVAYIMLLSTLTVIYAAAISALVGVFFPGVGLTLGQNAAFISFSIVISLTLPPLRRFFQHATDRIFFRDNYDPQALVNRISDILASQLELQPLMDKFLRELMGTMHLANAQLIVLEGSQLYGNAARGRLTHGPLGIDALHLFKHPLLVADDMASGPLQEALHDLEIKVVLQLRAHGELIGYLILGDKLSGEVYSNQDLAVLEIMRKELAVAVANAKAYDEIAAFNVTLLERIRDATKRLKVAKKNLRVLDKTKDDFISMASHQLGTPLTAITGYLSMALDNDNKNMTPDQREFVGYALEAAEKMVYMSGDMLNVSRLNSGRFMIQRQTIDLAKAIQQEIHQLMPSAERKGLKLTTELPSQPVLASVDESKTRQVIMNFIDNALYYTQAGGVHVKLEAQAGHVRFTVTDTGIGVPPEEQSKLFAKFFRAGNAKDIRPDGTGLGLYLAKRVIEDQGGTIIFASEVGKGSTFGFDLPIQG